MQATQWEYTKVPASQLAHGYRREDNEWKEEPLLHDGAYGAMGGLLSSVEDFVRYMTYHLSAWPPRSSADKGPVKRSSLREMHRPGSISGMNAAYQFPNGRTCPIVTGYSYGLGWTLDCQQRTWIGHSGGLPGFGSQWRIFPEYGIGVVSFTNLTYTAPGVANLQALDTIIAMAGLKKRQLPASPVLVQRKNELVQVLTDLDKLEKSKLFAENFFLDQSADKRRKTINDLYAKAGKTIRVSDLHPENNLRGTFFIEGEKADIEVFFTLTPENRPLIQQLDMTVVPKK